MLSQVVELGRVEPQLRARMEFAAVHGIRCGPRCQVTVNPRGVSDNPHSSCAASLSLPRVHGTEGLASPPTLRQRQRAHAAQGARALLISRPAFACNAMRTLSVFFFFVFAAPEL